MPKKSKKAVQPYVPGLTVRPDDSQFPVPEAEEVSIFHTISLPGISKWDSKMTENTEAYLTLLYFEPDLTFQIQLINIDKVQ